MMSLIYFNNFPVLYCNNIPIFHAPFPPLRYRKPSETNESMKMLEEKTKCKLILPQLFRLVCVGTSRLRELHSYLSLGCNSNNDCNTADSVTITAFSVFMEDSL